MVLSDPGSPASFLSDAEVIKVWCDRTAVTIPVTEEHRAMTYEELDACIKEAFLSHLVITQKIERESIKEATDDN